MFKLYDENRKEIELPEGVIPLDVFVSSISRVRQKVNIEGRSGSVDYGSVDDYRTVELYVLLRSYDTVDYRLLRDEIYALFSRNFLYVEETRTRGKLYKVSIDSNYIPERAPRHARDATIMLPGETVDMPFAESIGTTADISGYKLKYSDEIWSYGMGLLYDEDSHRYIHAGTEFSIYNAGNVTVDPFEMDLKITIDPIHQSPDFFEMTNKTTGETFRVDEGMQGDAIVLDGPNVTINGLQALRKTNKQFISLAPGWNDFELKGTGSSRVEFDFRYYYK